jgi:rhomboid protease GluP
MLGRQTQGSVVCPSCGRLVGVRDARCFNCGAPNPSLWGFAPLLRRLGGENAFANLLIGGCGLLYVVSLVLSRGSLLAGGGGLFSLLSPRGDVVFLLGASGSVPVFGYGRWWTVLSAAWLHGSLLHIAFNALWLRDLAPAVSRLYGAGRMILIWTAGSVVGFGASSLAGLLLPGVPFIGGSGLTLGASASLFAFFGALIWYGHRTGQSGMKRMVWIWALIGIGFGLVFPRIDNWAHVGGFAGGWLAARLLDPLRDERPAHVLGGLVCLVAALAAVVASVVTGLPVVAGN